ncbi:hypothetical protein IOLA_184 [uncultured bacterium]|nr:hypothetical protein IOLA_184 [uncultured bacterium]
MSQRDKINQKIIEQVDLLFDNSLNKEIKIDSISSSFTIFYNIKGKSKFMQTYICPLNEICVNRFNNLKIIVDKNYLDLINDNANNKLILIDEISNKKIKKEYSMALVDIKKLDKNIKSVLVKKSLINTKVGDKEVLLKNYQWICESKCTKLIQTNNSISCKIGNLSQGRDVIKSNLLSIIKFIQNKNIIIKKISLILHKFKSLDLQIKKNI